MKIVVRTTTWEQYESDYVVEEEFDTIEEAMNHYNNLEIEDTQTYVEVLTVHARKGSEEE